MNITEGINPDELLEAIQREENQKSKGRLKIFFGMCAGVGKTYAMLKEAQDLFKGGADIVVGTVDTHGRSDTEQLLRGLPTIPEKIIPYRGKEFKEPDIEAIIRQKPQLVLIDELAHSNIPGSKHAKRWQDVFELLDNGIDVYTTLNVQHVESLNDKIAGIAQVTVQETVPDVIVEKATSIQLVDLTPEELIQRLRDGKVYLGDQSRVASENFFQRDRLTALREIALRYAAEKVDHDLRFSIPTSADVIEWKPREKFLVAVSPSPYSQKLVRVARRLAANVNAPWLAVYVNTGKTLNDKDSNQLAKNLQIARDLGGEVITISDPSIVDGILHLTRQKGVTQIILGKTSRSAFFSFLRVQTLLDQLSNACADVDVHVLRQDVPSVNYRKKTFKFSLGKHSPSYLLVLLYVCLLTGLNWLLLPMVGYKIVGVIFLVAILTLSLFVKKGPIFFASILYAFSWGIFFVPPINEIEIQHQEDLALLVIYVLTAIATGILVDRAREHQEMLAENEASARMLYDIGQQVIIAKSAEELFKSVKEQLSKKFDGQFEIIAKDIDNGLIIDASTLLLKDESERAVALWAFQNGQEAGWSTDTLPSAHILCVPLKVFNDVVGVLVFKPKGNKVLLPGEKSFLYDVCRQLAIYIERLFFEQKAKQNAQLKQLESIQKTILHLLSDELQLPLKRSEDSIEALKDKITSIKEIEHFSKEVSAVENSFNALRRIVSNISAMDQLSEGMIHLNIQPEDIRALIEECCENIKKSKNSHKIEIKIQEGLPLISLDYYLIHMLLYNLVMNALEYSPPFSTIEIEAKKIDGFFVLSVADEGPGIPESQLENIFEKFYRLPEAHVPGIGLGLAIAKTVAEAHNGYLQAENLTPKGAKFSLFIPVEASARKRLKD